MRQCISGLLACGVAVTLLAGCQTESQRNAARKLKELEKEGIATATWDGLTLTETEKTDLSQPKSPGAYLTRCYELSIPHEKAVETILTTAEEQGWQERKDLGTDTTILAEKQVGGEVATLHVNTDATAPDCANTKGRPLMVTLTYM